MKTKSASIFRVWVIAFIFLFSPAYIDYQELTEVDFLSSGGKYEDRDIEDFSLGKQLNFTIGSSPFSIFAQLGNGLLASLTSLSLQTLFSDRKPFALRC